MREGYGKRTLVDSYRGKRLNSPNDIARHSSGALYFTDPPYGLPGGWEDPMRELDFCGVYRIDGDGELLLLTDELRRPNGLAFSPDESILYVAQSDGDAPVIMAYPVSGDESLGAGRVLFDASPYREGRSGLPDGLKVDESGNLWATGPGGVYVLTPSGELLGILATGEATSNCAWGGDGSKLYITADTYVLRIQTRTKGAGF